MLVHGRPPDPLLLFLAFISSPHWTSMIARLDVSSGCCLLPRLRITPLSPVAMYWWRPGASSPTLILVSSVV